MHCFASENQTYSGTWLFGVESWKSLKGQENLQLKNLRVKTRVENVRFLSWRIFFVGKYGIQSSNEMAFKRTVTLRASFRFPVIRFDAPTLLSFSGFTHAHAKCPSVLGISWKVEREETRKRGARPLAPSHASCFARPNRRSCSLAISNPVRQGVTWEAHWAARGFARWYARYEPFGERSLTMTPFLSPFLLMTMHFECLDKIFNHLISFTENDR